MPSILVHHRRATLTLRGPINIEDFPYLCLGIPIISEASFLGSESALIRTSISSPSAKHKAYPNWSQGLNKLATSTPLELQLHTVINDPWNPTAHDSEQSQQDGKETIVVSMTFWIEQCRFISELKTVSLFDLVGPRIIQWIVVRSSDSWSSRREDP